MLEILIALLSSATTILCLILQKKLKDSNKKKNLLDILSSENVEEIKIYVKNKGSKFKYINEASSNKSIPVSIEFEKTVSDDTMASFNDITRQIERIMNV